MQSKKEITWFAADKIRGEVLAPEGTRGTVSPDDESWSDRYQRISETGCLHDIPHDHYECAHTLLQHVCIGVAPDHNDMFAIERDDGKYRFYFQMVRGAITRLLTEEETELVKEIIANPPRMRITFGDGDDAEEMIVY